MICSAFCWCVVMCCYDDGEGLSFCLITAIFLSLCCSLKKYFHSSSLTPSSYGFLDFQRGLHTCRMKGQHFSHLVLQFSQVGLWVLWLLVWWVFFKSCKDSIILFSHGRSGNAILHQRTCVRIELEIIQLNLLWVTCQKCFNWRLSSLEDRGKVSDEA